MIRGKKIEQLATYYAEQKGVTTNTFHFFCLEEKLGYSKWTTYKNKDKANWTALLDLMRIFPKLNLNWLFKDIGPMFLDENAPKNNFDTIFRSIQDNLEDLKAFHNEAKGDE